MLPYWLFLFVFVIAALIGPRALAGAPYPHAMLLFGSVLIALMIGLRFEVGADWRAYIDMLSYSKRLSLSSALNFGDPGYMFLNWMAAQIGGSMWVVNLACGGIFAWGLYQLARLQPYPWVAMLVAIPYLVIVVAMGYSRQGVAIGILMAGLAHISRGGKPAWFVVYAAAAAMFHRTAVIALPIAVFGSGKRSVFTTGIVIAGVGLLFQALVTDHMDTFIQNYISARYNSQGAAIRLIMNFVPATLFFIARKHLYFKPEELRLWRNFSLASYGAIALYFILPSSTAVDRLALYALPLQIVVMSRLPILVRSEFAGKAMIITYSSAILFVWLNFGTNAIGWLPYRAYWPFA